MVKRRKTPVKRKKPIALLFSSREPYRKTKNYITGKKTVERYVSLTNKNGKKAGITIYSKNIRSQATGRKLKIKYIKGSYKSNAIRLAKAGHRNVDYIEYKK